MLRTLLTITLIFSLSFFSGTSYLYAKCRPGHGDGGGGSASSSRGGGGSGMSGAAGAAAGLGLLFSVWQATRGQEDVEVDVDEFATEYATAFNLMDPTVSLKLNYSLEIDDSDIVILQSGSKIVVIEECSCGGGNCTCPKEDACGALFWKKEVSDWQDKWTETDGPEAAAIWENTLRNREKSLNEAEKKCNNPGGMSGGGTGVATATPGCSCNAVGNNCVCPEAFACGGARHVVQWDGESGGVLSAEWVCGGASGGGTGVAIDEPPPEDSPVCRCDTNGCVCPHDGACFVSTFTGAALWWSEKAMDATPGSPEAQEYADKWNLSREVLERRLRECKGEIPMSDPFGFTTPSMEGD